MDVLPKDDIISDITIEKNFINDIVSARFNSDNIIKFNSFRRSMLSEIPIYAIEIVIFYVNQSSLYDEMLAHRLGMLVIDNVHFREHFNDQILFTVNIINDKSHNIEFSTDDIPDIQFAYPTPISILRPKEHLHFTFYVRVGTGKTHVKWRPISMLGYQLVDNKYIEFQFNNLGMLPAEEIISQGIDHIKDAETAPAPNIFFKQMVS